MDLKDLHAKAQLDNFLCLCNKAQELIFKALQDNKTCHFFSVVEIGDEVSKMSPIEQIFYVGNYISSVAGGNFFIELECQKEIVIVDTDKKYRVDFIVSFYIEKRGDTSKEYDLIRPIVIELDGKDYHSTTKQINADYERENDLKLQGYDIIRFTGRQVYNDVFGCLDKVCKLIEMADKIEV